MATAQWTGPDVGILFVSAILDMKVLSANMRRRLVVRMVSHEIFAMSSVFNWNDASKYYRAAKHIYFAENVKTVRLCTEFKQTISNIF